MTLDGSMPIPDAVKFFSDEAEHRSYPVVDENGRLIVLIAFNNDVADSWQWADDPRYPSERVNLGLRLAVNIAVYAMTH